MNNIHKNNVRRILSTVCGILSIGVLLCTAILFPKYYCLFHDNNTLNKVVYTESHINTYETAYASFAEKLHALARANTIGSSLHAVPMKELGIKRSRKELTRIVNRELKKLYQYHVLTNKMTLQKKCMTLFERYTVYETNTENGLQGISLWKLTYENKTETVTLFLDEEYHKIYSLKIYSEKNKTSNYSETSASVTSATEYTDGDAYKKYSWKWWWNGILLYYDLFSYSQMVGQVIGETGTFGTIEFEKPYQEMRYQMFLISDFISDESGRQCWILGSPLEQMIQF